MENKKVLDNIKQESINTIIFFQGETVEKVFELAEYGKIIRLVSLCLIERKCKRIRNLCGLPGGLN